MPTSDLRVSAPSGSEQGPVLVDDILSKAGGRVVHHVSLGSADVCESLGLPTGCDANFSLAANEYADGTVKGQWHDQLKGGTVKGIHVSIDCLNVVGNGSVIGGVVTQCVLQDGTDLSGIRAVTAVIDNGTSKNDAPDQMSFSYVGNSADCHDLVPSDLALFDVPNGQVKVR